MTSQGTALTHTDSNVYILGAGFSKARGLPLMRDFMNVMRDSVGWLRSNKPEEEAQAVGRVLGFRLGAAAATYRIRFDAENVEELFSLASASVGGDLAKYVSLAIAVTLDYAANIAKAPLCEVRFDATTNKAPPTWTRIPGTLQTNVRGKTIEPIGYNCDAYDVFAGVMAGYFSPPSADRSDTIITFNYDLLVEDALSNLKMPFAYGFRKETVAFDSSALCAQGVHAESATRVLKLHGSLNWAVPGKQGGKLTVYKDYNAVRQLKLSPLLTPPTWRKVFGRQLSDIWDEAVNALKTATRIVVLGYSLPEVDQHFKYLLAAGLQENISLRKVIVENPALHPEHSECANLTQRLYAVLNRDRLPPSTIDEVRSEAGIFFLNPTWRQLISRDFSDSYYQAMWAAP